MMNADKFIEKLIDLTLKDALEQRKGSIQLKISGTTLSKAQRILEKYGYSVIGTPDYFEIVPDVIKELR